MTRLPVPDGAFKPTDLEATISQLITEIGKTDSRSLALSVTLKDLTPYWQPVVTGSNRAIGELGVAGVVSGAGEPTVQESIDRQVQILRDQRQHGYNGFGVAPLATDVGVEMDAAVAGGVPVVTIDSDLPASKRQLYIGTLNYEAGKTAGQTMVNLVGTGTGTVILLGHDTESDWPDGFHRTSGAKDALEAAGYTVVIRRTDWSDTGEAADVAALQTMYTAASPPVVGMLGLFSDAFRCAMAAEAMGKTTTDVAIAGFDFEAKTLQYMKSGMMRATHVQRQYYMGYLLPYVLYSIDVLGLEKTKEIIAPQLVGGDQLNTGLDVVGAEQIDDYNAFLDSLGIRG